MSKTKGATILQVFSIYFGYARRRFWSFFFAIGFTAAAVAFEASTPSALRRVFDVFTGDVHAPETVVLLSHALLILFSLRVASWGLWRLGGWININFQPRTMAELQVDAYKYLLGHSYQFFADNFSGSLVKRIGRFVRAFEVLADEITYRWIPITVVMTGGAIGLYRQTPVFTLVFLGWFVVLFCFSIFAARWAVKADIERTAVDSELGGRMSDTISNAVTIKIFGSFDREVEAFKEVAHRYRRYQIRSWGRHEVIFLVQSTLSLALEMTFIYIGAMMTLRGELSIGDLVFIQTYLAIVFHQVWEMSRSLRHIFDAYADGKEMVDILQTVHQVRDVPQAKELKVTKGEIVFDGVTFGFGKEAVLKDFSTAISQGQKIALVGPSGAGKTTITKLLFRFYNVRSGKILIDGQNIAKVTQDSLRRMISMVPQDPILFHRSLRENIAYGKPDATDEEIIEAAKKAHCHEFIEKLPLKYETFVGERGVKLSGGERQRVAIARAILENAPILVLDEATSALDSESEALIQGALKELMKDKTVIAIAHRLSTIMNMDRILVIEDGRISADGTHEELVEKAGVYQKLWSLQAGSFIGE